jgi:succinoglycan biosynthesis protein ExoL
MFLYVTLRSYGPTISRRLLGFRATGATVSHLPLWPEMGTGSKKPPFYGERIAFFRRLRLAARGVLLVRRAMKRLPQDAVAFPVSLDCLLVVLLARALSGRFFRIVYEAHDVHEDLLRPSRVRPLLRWIHRRALKGIDLLIVPSQGSIDQFYRPIADYHGRYALVHNRLSPAEFAGRTLPPGFSGTWIVGFFGGLKCRRTLDLACAVAARLGDRVRFLVAGSNHLGADALNSALSAHANVVYLGPYRTQQDIADLYAKVHFGWAFHFDPPEPAHWALFARLFESGAYGRPLLAAAGGATGEFVTEHGIGKSCVEPLEDELVALLEQLQPSQYSALTQRIDALDLSLLVGDSQLAEALAMVGR